MTQQALALQIPEPSSPVMDDSQIIAEFLRTEDPDLFELLVERYQERVFRLTLSVLGADFSAEAEELVQEVFVVVYQQLSTFRHESKFATWLYRITYNRAIDLKRRARYQRPHVGDEELTTLPDSSGRSPYDAAEQSEQSKAIRACIDELPDLYRSVLYLHYWMDCSYDEIGNFLSVPVGTVKSYLHRARQRLYARMRKKGLADG